MLSIMTFFFHCSVTVVLIPFMTFLIYLPSVFRWEIIRCVLETDGIIIYHKRDNDEFLESLFYSVSKIFFNFGIKA
jgi:neurotensin receptor 1